MFNDMASNEPICWKFTSIDTHGVHNQDWSSNPIKRNIESYSKTVKALVDL